MKDKLLMATATILLLTSCSKQEATNREILIESSSLISASISEAKADPFCLHVKYSNRYYYLYSENYAEGWVTNGACSPEGARRSIQNLSVGWRYKGESQGNRQCANADSCSFSEKNYGIGKTIECSVSSGKEGNQSAHASTDPIACR